MRAYHRLNLGCLLFLLAGSAVHGGGGLTINVRTAARITYT